MRRKTETLATVGLFRSLDAANIDLLDTQCSWRRLSRNQWIVDYQDTSNDVFFIVSGAVRVKLQSASGREVLLREINAGIFSANWPRSTMRPVRRGSSPSRMSRSRGCRHRFFAPQFTHILTYATNSLRYLRVRFGCWPIV